MLCIMGVTSGRWDRCGSVRWAVQVLSSEEPLASVSLCSTDGVIDSVICRLKWSADTHMCAFRQQHLHRRQCCRMFVQPWWRLKLTENMSRSFLQLMCLADVLQPFKKGFLIGVKDMRFDLLCHLIPCWGCCECELLNVWLTQHLLRESQTAVSHACVSVCRCTQAGGHSGSESEVTCCL